MFEKIKAWIKRKRETAREQQAADRLIKHIEQALGFELYEWQRLYIITGIWQPPEGRLHGRTTAYILRLLLDQSKPLLLYEFSQVAAYADNPFMGRQYQPVPITDMANYGFHMDDVYQGENLTPVIREFEGIIKDGDFKIADNNLLKTHFLNVALKHNMETRKFRPIKIEQRAHIDGFVSVIDAMTVRQKYWEECGELLKNAA